MSDFRRTLENSHIIFLDFDGVLNHSGCKSETDFTAESISVLNKIHDEYNTEIVLSTSWKDAFIFTELTKLLKEKGIRAPIIDKTPTYKSTDSSTKIKFAESESHSKIGPNAGRNWEILTYVHTHNVKHYIILDDFMITNPELIPHLVQTCYFDENGGLKKSHIKAIEKAFEIQNAFSHKFHT